MRVLVVNNGRRYPNSLVALFPAQVVEVVSNTEVITKYPVSDHDCIVLSGSNHVPIHYHQDALAPLFAWICTQTKPLLGICYGAELLAVAYGGQLVHMDENHKQKGFYTTTAPAAWPLPTPFCAYEGHQWNVTSLAPPLVSILTSSRGIIAFTHHTLPQVGCIFHPEKYRDETDGYDFFRQFLMRHLPAKD